MAKEIERKFLVNPKGLTLLLAYGGSSTPVKITQGYLSLDSSREVRVRIKSSAESKAYLTVKAKTSDPTTRSEFEYEIPVVDAEQLLSHCTGSLIQKTRYKLGRWEVDIFEEANKGLFMAEIELTDPAEEVPLPKWLDIEVTGDPRYKNAALAIAPFASWR